MSNVFLMLADAVGGSAATEFSNEPGQMLDRCAAVALLELASDKFPLISSANSTMIDRALSGRKG